MSYMDIIKAISMQRWYDRQVIGKCSICGGLVTLPWMWGGTKQPAPTCSSCGAEAERPDPYKDIPVIPMEIYK